MLSKKYQTEQEELLVKIDKLTAELSDERQSVIHKGKDSQNGMRAQPIEIYYRFIGKID